MNSRVDLPQLHNDSMHWALFATQQDACELLQKTFDVPRCVVRAMDPAWTPKFHALGQLGAGQGDVCVCDHVTASMQNLLDQFITSPQSAIMLLHDDPGADVIKACCKCPLRCPSSKPPILFTWPRGSGSQVRGSPYPLAGDHHRT